MNSKGKGWKKLADLVQKGELKQRNNLAMPNQTSSPSKHDYISAAVVPSQAKEIVEKRGTAQNKELIDREYFIDQQVV